MSVERIVLMVEEPSMEAALRLLLPRIVGTLEIDVHTYQCKDELLARLPTRLLGYAKWIPKNWRIVVVVDRDDDDCFKLKKRLDKIAAEAGLVTRSKAGTKPYVVVNRLAIEELEAWYFGDWEAVRASYPRVPPTIPFQSKFRNPDAISGGTWEALQRVLQQAGYFKMGFAKIEAARAIAKHMVPSRNCSKSFQVLHKALIQIAES